MLGLTLAAMAAHSIGFRELTSPDVPLIMRRPTVNHSSIVFEFAGDLWSVPRQGGDAQRLTSSRGQEGYARFSPDGTMIAFTGEYDGNLDVYLMPAKGGSPKRLTTHPGADIVAGWTPDSKSILFVSTRLQDTDLPRLFTVGLDGKPAKPLPLPSGSQGSYSPDSKHIAYNPGIKWQDAWKRYRGGQTYPIWIADLSDSRVKEIPRKNSNDHSAIWIGDTIYFLSDRKGVTTLFSYSTKNGQVNQLLEASGEEMKSMDAGAGAIVIEKFGSIVLYDIASKTSKIVPITIRGDFAEIRPQHKKVGDLISNGSISPTGMRVAFEARGDIITVPAEKGDPKNLTQSSGVADRMPTWSPDGQTIAYFSDESGEYQLVTSGPSGKKSYTLGDSPAYYFSASYSPNGEYIAYKDSRHKTWILDLKTGKNELVDETPYENPAVQFTMNWSPDSKWLAYSRELESHMMTVFLYSLATKKRTQIADGLAACSNPIFDAGGEYLYFTASTNSAPANGWLDISSLHTLNVTSNVYCVVLKNDAPSPLAPESDDEPTPGTNEPGKEEAKKPEFRIDVDNIEHRIVTLPIRSGNYAGLLAGPPGTIFLLESGALASITSTPRTVLNKFDLDSKMMTPFVQNVQSAEITNDRKKLLLFQNGIWSIVSAMAPPPPGSGALDTSEMECLVEPSAEWRQMFREAWRIQRDYLYDPHTHGISIPAMMKRYEPYLEAVCSRSDLNELFTEMLGEICIGHMFIGGGDIPTFQGTPGGLLGADYSLENGRYRFARVYDGESWNPGVFAPLAAPGVAVRAGEYLIAVDGKNLTSDDDIYLALEAKAGKQVELTISANASGTPSRKVIVVPIANETGLRHLAWVEDNRRKVDALSNGRVGYVHVPDTGGGGWLSFNRYFFSQTNKEGFLIDERFNHGGFVNDFMIEVLRRPLESMWMSRYGKDFGSPVGAVYGPKVMLINQYAGSGGDYFPWLFRESKIGPLIGKRTWGGLVGILFTPTLIDGGSVTSPNVAFYNHKTGAFEIENYGVEPDVEVELDPYLWRQGRDAQLERGVQEVLKRITTKPSIKRPKFMDKTKVDGG